MNGLLVIDKPTGMTSHDVVSRLRRATGESAIGHLGTLDPLATGVLPMLLGKYTRLAQFFGPLIKTYTGTIRFGFATDTYDADGTPVAPAVMGAALPANQDIQAAAAFFRGQVDQTPPPYSAKKVDGKPAYKAARRGESVVLKPVSLTIDEFVIGELAGEYAEFTIRISSGGYVRSVAHDLGIVLGCGAPPGKSAANRRWTLYPGPGPHPRGTERAGRGRHPRTKFAASPNAVAGPAGHDRRSVDGGAPEKWQCGESAGVLDGSAGQGVRRAARPGGHCAPGGRHALSTHRGSRLMARGRQSGFPEQRHDQGKQILGHLGIALLGGMNAVGLHAAGNPIRAQQQEWLQRYMVLGRQQRIGLVELMNVVGAVIGWQGYAAQHHLDAGVLQRSHNLIEIFPGVGDGQSAQSVVSAEGHDHQHRLEPQCVLQPIDPVFGGVSADALVDDLVVIALRVQILFQEVRIAVTRVGAEAGGETIAEGDDDRTAVRLRCLAGRRGVRRCRLRRSVFRSLGPAAGKQGTGNENAGKSSEGHRLTLKHFLPFAGSAVRTEFAR